MDNLNFYANRPLALGGSVATGEVFGMRVVKLWDGEEAGLIYLWPTGVVFSNQTGGYACLQPGEEGFYVPLGPTPPALEEHFTGEWSGHCSDGIDEATADFVDELLQTSPPGIFSRSLRVDRTRLKDSHEAWIYVTVPEETVYEELRFLRGFGPGHGVLTWPNSD